MKLRSTLRAAAVLAGVAGLAGVLVPPAAAEGMKTVVFAGRATVTEGLGYPCTNTTPPTVTVPDTSPTKGQKTCPPDVRVNPGANKKQKLVDVNGDTRTGRFESTDDACVASGLTFNKGKQTLDAGPCVILSTFVVTGYCGLSQGVGRATVTVDNQLGANQTYNADYTWFSSGTVLTVRGQAWTGATKPATPDWYLTGTVSAAPNPLVAGTSCTNKTGQSFLIEGVVVLVHPNPSTLP